MTMPDQQTTSDPCSSPSGELIAIEMIGLPGAGKSTLIKRLLPAFQSHGQASSGFLRLHRCLAGDSSLANYLRCQEAAIADARSRGDRFCVFQEGALHEVWRMGYKRENIPPKLLERAVKLPNIVICLEVSLEVARNRIRGKIKPGPINLELRDAPIPGDGWDRAANAMGAILGAIPPDRLLMTGNNTDLAGEGLEEKAKQIAARISRELSHRPPNPAR